MLKNVINDNLLKCRGVVGFFKAHQSGDDIEVYNENGDVLETFYGIRQQVHVHYFIASHLLAVGIFGVNSGFHTADVELNLINTEISKTCISTHICRFLLGLN